MKLILIILTLSFALADAFVFRAKTEPITVLGFNLFLELSKVFYLVTITSAIYLGKQFQWRYVIAGLLLLFVMKGIPFNLAAGLQWNYVGMGLFDTIIKFVTFCNTWMWIALQIIALVISWLLIKNKL